MSVIINCTYSMIGEDKIPDEINPCKQYIKTKNKISNLANSVDWKRTGLNFSRYADGFIMGIHPICRGFLDDSLTRKEKTMQKIIGTALVASQIAPAVIGRVGERLVKTPKGQEMLRNMVQKSAKVKINTDKGYTYYKTAQRIRDKFFVFKDPEPKIVEV